MGTLQWMVMPHVAHFMLKSGIDTLQSVMGDENVEAWEVVPLDKVAVEVHRPETGYNSGEGSVRMAIARFPADLSNTGAWGPPFAHGLTSASRARFSRQTHTPH